MMLGYHELTHSLEKDVYAVSAQKFRRHAEIVHENCGNAMCITFDDGHISQFAIAYPILLEFGLPALFFITTAWVGQMRSVVHWEQLRELSSSGYVIGSHSHTHPMLTACSAIELRNELSMSRRILEDRLGREVTTISIPAGRMNQHVLASCAEAGYRHVYTSSVGEYQCPTGALPEVIGRFIVTRGLSEKRLASYLERDPSTLNQLRLKASVKKLAKTLLGDAVYQKAWRKAVRSESPGA